MKRLRQFYSRNGWMYKSHLIHFSDFTFLVNNVRTVIARKLFVLENIGLFIPFRMLPIRFRYIEPFWWYYDLKKKVKKTLTSNIYEIYRTIILPKEVDHELTKIYLHKEFWRDKVNLTFVIVGCTKLILFIFQILGFFNKNRTVLLEN